jgi:hypothetical protein
MTQIGLNLSKKFAKDSADALADMEATGKGHALEDVQVYFARLKKYRQGQGVRPLALEPKAMH